MSHLLIRMTKIVYLGKGKLLSMREKKGLPDTIYELWSPVASVALLTKFLLHLRRTYQVRILYSGEIDTYNYVQQTRKKPGQWIKN